MIEVEIRTFLGYYCPCGYVYKISRGQEMAADLHVVGVHAWDCMKADGAQICFVSEQVAAGVALVWAMPN